MPKDEVPSRSEQEADECLHCAIIDIVDERIAAGGANAADLATLIVESLVDIILRVPEEEQAQLMAHTLAALGDLFIQKSGGDGGDALAALLGRHAYGPAVGLLYAVAVSTPP